MKRSHERAYLALKWVGHSPCKALEIVIDAQRGCSHARQWCRVVLRAALDAHARGEGPWMRTDAQLGRIRRQM